MWTWQTWSSWGRDGSDSDLNLPVQIQSFSAWAWSWIYLCVLSLLQSMADKEGRKCLFMIRCSDKSFEISASDKKKKQEWIQGVFLCSVATTPKKVQVRKKLTCSCCFANRNVSLPAAFQPFKPASSSWVWGCCLLTVKPGSGAKSCGRSSRWRWRTWRRRWSSCRQPMSTNRSSWRRWGRYHLQRHSENTAA